MKQSPFGSGSFLDFSDRLTGYRLSAILLLIEEVALFDVIGEQGGTGERICAQIGWDQAYGKRFLDCLWRLGLLEQDGDLYHPSRFSRSFLCQSAPSCQNQTLQFEHQLHQSWQRLDATLRSGQRIFSGVDTSGEELQAAIALYLGAMDEAAAIRAEELWEALGPLPEQGCILDIGAGSGAFLAACLRRYPGWSAIFCDLPQVVDSSCHQCLDSFATRIFWCRANLLAEEPSQLDDVQPGSCDLVLLSNLIHCQGREETTRLLERAAEKSATKGLLLIHDFFSDCGWRGALYDLHMMLNTYNGRTYLLQECVEMAARISFCCHTMHPLGSGSTLLAFARSSTS
ncbi:MAG: methyltransferase [Desulfobulbus sp.]|nr:methyltransferase [Desulfobulbus sp.]